MHMYIQMSRVEATDISCTLTAYGRREKARARDLSFRVVSALHTCRFCVLCRFRDRVEASRRRVAECRAGGHCAVRADAGKV